MVAKHLSQHALQRIHLNGISQGRPGAVALDEPHVLGLHGALLQPGCELRWSQAMAAMTTTESQRSHDGKILKWLCLKIE